MTGYELCAMFAACAAAGTPEMLQEARALHVRMEGIWNKLQARSMGGRPNPQLAAQTRSGSHGRLDNQASGTQQQQLQPP